LREEKMLGKVAISGFKWFEVEELFKKFTRTQGQMDHNSLLPS
jgi:hypothetical protein